jgi:hypothetical protein
VSLTSRYLEENGIPTVVLGCAKDLVETCGVARFVWSDFPLGHSAGRPKDEESKSTIVRMALDLLETAVAPRTTLKSPFRWSDDPSWKSDFWRVEQDAAKRAATQQAFEAQKATHKATGSVTSR